MTHADAIATVLALTVDAPAPAPSVAARAAAVDHLAHCSDCWTTIAEVHVLATGVPPAEHAALASRFGCEPVQEVLYALVDLEQGTLAREHAFAARHLAWCLACRTRFAELVAVEREAAAAPRWVVIAENVREAAGRLVVRIGRTVAGLVEIPETFTLVPAAAPVPVRGDAAPGALAQATRFELGESGVSAELGVESSDPAHVGLALRLTTADAGPFSVRLYEVRPEGDVAVARYTLRGAAPVLVRDLWPGSFVVELVDSRAGRSYRVRLDVGPAA